MDAPWKHYAKWLKTDSRGQILYDSPLCGKARIGTFRKTVSRIVVARGLWGGENGELLFKYWVYVGDKDNILSMDRGDGYTLCIYLMPVNYTLTNG